MALVALKQSGGYGEQELVGAEQRIEGRGKLWVCPVLGTNNFASDLAVAADQISFRNHRGTVSVRDLFGWLTKGGEALTC